VFKCTARPNRAKAPPLRIGRVYNLRTGSPSDRWVTLRDDTAQVCRDFIRTDLQVCITLTWVAETAYDSGNREHAAKAIAKAEKGYSDLLRFFSRTKHLTPEAREELQWTFKRLRERLDGLQRA
jgi:hypothetical protein